MKILHLIDEPYDSGIAHYALTVAAGLFHRGHPSYVWGREGSHAVSEARRLGIETSEFSRPWSGLAALRRRLYDRSIDLAVAHTGAAHAMAALASAEHGRSIALIRTRGDARPMRLRPGAKLLWGRTRGFIAANARILDEHRRLCARSGLRSAVIYEGQEARAVRPPPNGAPCVGIVGRLDPVKGHGDFLRSAALVLTRFPDARFLVVGRQENVKTEDLRSLARTLGLGDRLDFTGHVPDARGMMDRCHIGVIASTGSEAISRVAVEWMAAGRPLVSTSVGCLPEYVWDGRTGLLVSPGDPQSLAAAVGRLIQDAFLRERMGEEARRRYEELFTLDRFLEQTELFYEETVHCISSR